MKFNTRNRPTDRSKYRSGCRSRIRFGITVCKCVPNAHIVGQKLFCNTEHSCSTKCRNLPAFPKISGFCDQEQSELMMRDMDCSGTDVTGRHHVIGQNTGCCSDDCRDRDDHDSVPARDPLALAIICTHDHVNNNWFKGRTSAVIPMHSQAPSVCRLHSWLQLRLLVAITCSLTPHSKSLIER